MTSKKPPTREHEHTLGTQQQLHQQLQVGDGLLQGPELGSQVVGQGCSMPASHIGAQRGQHSAGGLQVDGPALKVEALQPSLPQKRRVGDAG